MSTTPTWKQRLHQLLSLDAPPAQIAGAFAVGVFISFTPFFGLHTAMAVAVAFLLRLNKLACLTGAWVNTPLTVVPALVASYKLGRLLRGLPPHELRIRGLEWQALKPYATSLLIGSALIGLAAALAGYALLYWLILRLRHKDPTLEELGREMDEVGDQVE